MNLVILALAVARLARLVAVDGIAEGPRNWVLSRWPASDTEFGDSAVITRAAFVLNDPDVHETRGGARVFWLDGAWRPVNPHWLGELITCYWCNSFWIGVIVWTLYSLYPDATVLLAAPFALSFAAGWLNDR